MGIFKGNYKYFTQHNATSFTKGRGKYGITPQGIALHHWGVMGQSFQGVINFFCSPNCQTSAHYVVCADNVACLVNCSDTAWHLGNWDANQKYIGIECRPECSEADRDTVAQLVAEIWQAFPNMPRKLVQHGQFYNTACAGLWRNYLGEIERKALGYLNGTIKLADKPKPPTFIVLKKGDVATIGKHATHFQDTTPIPSTIHGKSGRIVGVIDVHQSFSKKAYLLEGVKSYVLEQDILECRGSKVDKPVFITSVEPPKPKPVEKHVVDTVNVKPVPDTGLKEILDKLNKLETLAFGNAKIIRDGKEVSALQELAEIRTKLDKVFK